MRPRGSLLGPIVILALGVLFLLKNFRPDIPVWPLVGKYWPVLLIVWGLAKLGEAIQPKPPGALPRPLMTVGEFCLVVLLVLIGMAVFEGSRWNWGNINIDTGLGDLFANNYTFTQEVRQRVEERAPTIVVVNPSGAIRVIGGEGSAIEVKAEKRVQARDETEAKRLADMARVEISREGSQYTVRSNADRTRGAGSVRAALEVHVPRAATLDLQARRGDVQVSDVSGPVSVHVEQSGDVSLSEIAGKVQLKMRRGSLTAQKIHGDLDLDGRGRDIQVSDVQGEVTIRGDYTGRITFANVTQKLHMTTSRTEIQMEKLPGKVDMTLGSLTITEPVGPLNITTGAKDIRIEEFQGPVQILDRDATVELITRKLPLKDIDVENRSGRIEVSLPSSSEFQIDATARRGDVNSDFPISGQKEGDMASLRGSVGTSGPTIKLSTTFGTIYLRKLG